MSNSIFIVGGSTPRALRHARWEGDDRLRDLRRDRQEPDARSGVEDRRSDPDLVVDKQGSRRLDATSPQTRCCASSRRRSESTGRREHRGFGCSSTPYCSFSVRAFDEPCVADERVQLAIIPISILDYENNGQSTSAAEALLSQEPAHMAEAWEHRSFGCAPSENRRTFCSETITSLTKLARRARRRPFGKSQTAQPDDRRHSERLERADRTGRGAQNDTSR
jgi:hypothetical protein